MVSGFVFGVTKLTATQFGDGKRLSLRAICLDHTAHGLLDPVRLRPGDRELVANLHRHIRKKIIVHTCLPISKNFPAKAGLPALRA